MKLSLPKLFSKKAKANKPVSYAYTTNQPYNITKWNRKRQRSNVQAKHEDKLVSNADRQQLRIEARNQYRNNPLARAIAHRLQTAVVGNWGLIPQFEGEKQWGSKAERLFMEWAKIADIQGHDLIEIQKLIVNALLLDGEIFVLQLSSGLIQTIEAERIFTPNEFKDDPFVYDGIRVNNYGRPLGYYVNERNENGYADSSNYSYKLAKDVIHIRAKDRIDQLRGVPLITPALEKLIDLYETQIALQSKIKTESKMAVAIKNNGSDTGAGNLGDRFAGNLSGGTDEDEGTKLEYIYDNSVFYLQEGEDISTVESKNPNSNYQSYIDTLVTEICASVGLSSEFVTCKYGSSYIASRGSLLITQTTVEEYQLILELFMQRLWNWRIFKEIQNGNLANPPRDNEGLPTFFRVNWVAPRIPSLDESAEANADALQWKNASTSLTKIAKKRGYDFQTLMDERISEAEYIIQKAKDKNIPLWMLFPPSAGIPITYEEPKEANREETK